MMVVPTKNKQKAGMDMRLVKVLPAREKTAEIRELLDLGWTEHDVVVKVFGTSDRWHLAAVRGVRDDPHGYHTDVDEVAVARALEGDRDVWRGLTHYERREVLLELGVRRELEALENAEERALVRGLFSANAFNVKNPHDKTPDWFVQLADAFGYTPKALGRIVREAVAARVL